MFLFTYSFQRKYVYLGGEKTKRVLDAIHEQIYSPNGHPSFSEHELVGVCNFITIRYTQYYKAIRNDLDTIQKGVRGILFYELTDSFIQNLLNKNINEIELQEYQKLTKFKILFGIFLWEVYKLCFDWFEGTKSKYEIKFD